MLLWNNHEMHRRQGVNVMKSKHVLIFINAFAGQLTAADAAKNAITHGEGRRAAFSSRPEMPSRRANSDNTSRGAKPQCANRIKEWNQRSAVSCTKCSLSPPLA